MRPGRSGCLLRRSIARAKSSTAWLTRLRQTLLKSRRIIPPVADKLGVKRRESQLLAAARPRTQRVIDRVLNGRRIDPVGAKEHPAAAADQVSHIRQRTVELMRGSYEVIDEDRPFDFKFCFERSRMREFLLKATMRGIVLARMRFPSVEKEEIDSFGSECPCHRLQRRRRQRAVRSGERAELDQYVPLLPVAAEPHRLMALKQGRVKIGRQEPTGKCVRNVRNSSEPTNSL